MAYATVSTGQTFDAQELMLFGARLYGQQVILAPGEILGGGASMLAAPYMLSHGSIEHNAGIICSNVLRMRSFHVTRKEKMAEFNEPACSTSSLSDSLASGTRFTTVSSDGEDVEDSASSVTNQ